MPAAVVTHPQNLAAGLQGARWSVVQRILLKRSWRIQMKACLLKLPFEVREGSDRNLQLNLGALHGEKYTAANPSRSLDGTIVLVDLKSKTERLDARRPADITRAAELLRTGHTVAFPTETVYGLGATALSPEAVAKIFAAKKRPHWDPLILHIADRQMLASICLSFRSAAEESASRSILHAAEALMEAFWPGPLTLLLPRTAAVPDAVTAGRPLVGVRMPNHPVALELIRQAGVPIAAPSANLFGHTSPTSAAHVLADLDGRIDAILDGGSTSVGVESTVAGFTRDGVMIYRPGAITASMIESVIGHGLVQHYVAPVTAEAPESLPSPGITLRHYSPRARLLLVEGFGEEELVRSKKPVELGLVDVVDAAFDATETLGVMLPDGWNASCAQLTFRWGDWRQPDLLAQRLYAGLRDLDDRGATTILCPVPASGGISEALRDRLRKAASHDSPGKPG